MPCFEPIAIVGQSCVLPGALTPQDLWQAIAKGERLISRAPSDYWPGGTQAFVAQTPSSGRPEPDTVSHDWGGYIKGFSAVFQPEEYGLETSLIGELDPLFQWLLYCAKHALAQCSYDAQNTGAVIGNLSYPNSGLIKYCDQVLRAQVGKTTAHPLNRFMSGYPAALLANAFSLGKRAYCIDAACASSLYAIKLACDELQQRRADVMLAGGLNAIDDLFSHVGFTSLGALSRTGQSRPFHRQADGLVPASGAALLTLKRLTDAQADGDTILVVIKGIGLSNDGRAKGLLSPSSQGQVRSMNRAYQAAGIDPTTISLIECHATGTPTGDKAELESLAHIFSGCTGVPIGSLKSNLGHLVTAAGVASVQKVIGAMHHNIRPATIGIDDELEAINASPFRLVKTAEPWLSQGPKRAAISAFGFGGNNAHLILEEYKPTDQHDSPAQYTPATKKPELTARPPTNNSNLEQPQKQYAVIGVAMHAAGINDTDTVAQVWFANQSKLSGQNGGEQSAPAQSVTIDCLKTGLSPADAEKTLPQQLMALSVCDEAIRSLPDGLESLDRENTGVFVGMGIDVHAALYGVRLHNLHRLEAASNRSLYGTGLQPLDSTRTLGCMPNMVANRISAAYDFTAPSVTFSSEEFSGIDALYAAQCALENKEITTALVGAVDLCCNPIHAQAVRECLPEHYHSPGDAAVFLVIKRLDDATRDADPIYAVLGPEHHNKKQSPVAVSSEQVNAIFGHAHAASGLVNVALAVLSARFAAAQNEHGAIPLGLKNDQHQVNASITSFTGRTDQLGIARHDKQRKHDTPSSHHDKHATIVQTPKLYLLSAATREQLLSDLKRTVALSPADRSLPVKLAIVARGESDFAIKKQQALTLLSRPQQRQDFSLMPGIYFAEKPLTGKIAFTFPPSAGAYSAMASELLLSYPSILDALFAKVSDNKTIQKASAWVFKEPKTADEITVFEKLTGSFLLCQAHSIFSREMLRLSPHGYIGFSAGETAALFASDVWSDMGFYYMQVALKGMWTEHLGGDLKVLDKAWPVMSEPKTWENWTIRAHHSDLANIISEEPLVHIATINTDNETSICGHAPACRRVVAKIGKEKCHRIYYDLIQHTPEIEHYKAPWNQLNNRKSERDDQVIYGALNAGKPYNTTPENIQQSLWQSATLPVDFTKIINSAYDDGVRIFIEHGPGSVCSSYTKSILGDKPHLSVALDGPKRNSTEQLYSSCAQLYVAGVDISLDSLNVENNGDNNKANSSALPFTKTVAVYTTSEVTNAVTAHKRTIPAMNKTQSDHMPLDNSIRLTAAPHDAKEYIYQTNTIPVAGEARALTARVMAAATGYHPQPIAAARVMQDNKNEATVTLAKTTTPTPASGLDKNVPAASIRTKPTGPSFDRTQLLVHSQGLISSIFGSAFTRQDDYDVQVRMPTEPLLLADRVVGIEATPGQLTQGRVWTETDVETSNWYVHQGHMAPGVMIEAGQADLFLISYMGIDFKNLGQRRYRLLGCDITYLSELPRPGETLHYEIFIDGHAQDGNTRLFFFHYDAYIGERHVMRMRGGQAGFFTEHELATAKGVLWEANQVQPNDQWQPSSQPLVRCTKQALNNADITAFTEGRLAECFGSAFAIASTHTRTPTIASKEYCLIHSVPQLDFNGGPWAQGYLRASYAISPNDWFFKGHFHKDPCMPGTLMVDMAYQGLAIYLSALGYTLNKDGWTFQPTLGQEIKLRCRTQVTPTAKNLTLEIFVRQVINEPQPKIIADILISVDGVKSVHGEKLSLSVVPDYPNPPRATVDSSAMMATAQKVASIAGIPCDEKQSLDCAWGKPSETFGYKFSRFDDGKRMARLPGAPYNFMSRVTDVAGEYCGMRVGTKIVSEWDIPSDCVFYSENGYPTLPYAVILEAVLQPCGWLACYLGCPLVYDEELFFRNLDGNLTLEREIFRHNKLLRCEVTSTNISKSGGTIIVSFAVSATVDGDRLCELTTVFGYFSAASLSTQKGLASTPEENAQLTATSDYHRSLANGFSAPGKPTLKLADKKLLMLDAATGYWVDGGQNSLGQMRAEKNVDISEWFFQAHFFQDPVQPGSLGLEALLQLVQLYMLEQGFGADMISPRFMSLATNQAITWRYRGQITPKNKKIQTMIEVIGAGKDDQGYYAVANGTLWADGLKIYDAHNIVMRITDEPNKDELPKQEQQKQEHKTTLTLLSADSSNPPVSLSREQLEQHSRGELTSGFNVDGRIKLPKAPFLLLDGIGALSVPEPGRAGETLAATGQWHLQQEAWYLDADTLSPSLLFEPAGQLTILLCSIYSHKVSSQPSRSVQRCYRALALSGVQYHSALPSSGATIKYTVTCNKVTSLGATELFYFNYQCWVGDTLIGSVESAIAGLVPESSLTQFRKSKRALDETRVAQSSHYSHPQVSQYRYFDRDKLLAFSRGKGFSCFGRGFESLHHHINPAKIASDDQLRYIDEIVKFDCYGGEHGLGYLVSKKAIKEQDWFFKAHFDKDPCMPAALIATGCIQSVSFFLAACGYTLIKDHHIFAPTCHQDFQFIGEGQVTPQDKYLEYSVTIRAIENGEAIGCTAEISVATEDHQIAKMIVSITLQACEVKTMHDEIEAEKTTCLPQDEKATAERNRLLREYRDKFTYDMGVLKDVPFSQDIPDEARAGQGWNYKIVNKLDRIRKNWEIAIEKNGYEFEHPLPEKSMIDVMQMLKDGDLLTFIQYTNPELGVAVRDKRPKTFDEYYQLFIKFKQPQGTESEFLFDDSDFVDYFLGGLNPLVIEKIERLKDNYAITEQTVCSNPKFQGDTLDGVINEGRLFIVDYEILTNLVSGIHPDQPKYVYSPIVYLAMPRNGNDLELLAIQNAQSPDALLVTPMDSKWDLLIAKTIVRSADVNHHELISHLGLTHLLIEPIVVSTFRQLAPNHPLHTILIPHFEGTIPINALAIKRLLAEDGRVEQLLAGDITSGYQLISKARNEFDFRGNFLHENLKRRGVEAGGSLTSYPYRDDALLHWQALESWCTDYVSLYYQTDADVTQDTELHAWVEEIRSPDYGRINGFTPTEGITTISTLIETLTMILFTCATQHSAINYPQEKASAVPYQPLAGYQAPPSVKGLTEQDAVEFLPPLDRALKQTNVLELLGTVYYTQLGKYEKDTFIDPRVAPLLSKFQADLDSVEQTIIQRNSTRRTKYEYLIPSKVAQSINI